MSEFPPGNVTTASAPEVSPLLVVAGILFILVWAAVSILVMGLSLMGTLMANDGGGASSDQHSTLVFGVLASQIAIGLAGLPAGLAFFWRSRRRLMLGLFAALLIPGLLGLVAAIRSF